MRKYLKLMRIHHYIKNLLIFAALACSGKLFDAEKLSKCIVGFIVFCLLSSVVYIINDIKDVEKDRKHPTKCNRPIAAGDIPLKKAIVLAFILIISITVISILSFNINAAILLIVYFAINVAYSAGLKNIAVVDIVILVSGFLIRVVFGAVITGVDISNWMYLTVIAISLYFALGKRRNEIKRISSGETRKVLKSYTVEFLDKNMNMTLTLANAFYALWSMDEKTMMHYNSRYLIFTVPIVLLITMKYSLNIEGDSDADPVEVLIHDKVLILLCIIYIATMFAILYI